jgi:hypothetical protein
MVVGDGEIGIGFLWMVSVVLHEVYTTPFFFFFFGDFD